MSLLRKFAVPLATFLLGAVFVAVITPAGDWFWRNVVEREPGYQILVEHCAPPMPKPYVIDSNEVAHLTVIEQGGPMLTHRTRLRNTGSEVISATLYFDFVPDVDEQRLFRTGELDLRTTSILDMIVFFESSLAQHEIEFDELHLIGTVKLKDFNPGDEISFMFESTNSHGASFSGKWSGLTFNSRQPAECEKSFAVGGVIAYRYTNERCDPGPGPTINQLNCNIKMQVKIPEDVSTGNARIEWRLE